MKVRIRTNAMFETKVRDRSEVVTSDLLVTSIP